MIREGPGGRVAVQLPSGPVVTAAAWVNAFEPLSGAVRIATGWPASGRPALLISSPCSLTGRPKGDAGTGRELRRGRYCSSCAAPRAAAWSSSRSPLAASGETATPRCSRRSCRRGSLRRRAGAGSAGARGRTSPSASAQTSIPSHVALRWLVPCRLCAGGAAASSLAGPLGHRGAGSCSMLTSETAWVRAGSITRPSRLRRSCRRCRRIGP